MNFRQTHLNDAGHLLARRVNMNEMALTYPLRYFSQTVFRTSVPAASASQDIQVNLTGFRAGSLKYIDLWLSQTADGAGNAVPAGNPFNWYALRDVVLSVNGLIYYNSSDNNGQLWSLCDRKTSASVGNTLLVAGSPATADPLQSSWTVVSMGQVEQAQAFESELALGLAIQNSVVNLQFKAPGAGTWVLSAAYHYAASLLFSKGSCDYVF